VSALRWHLVRFALCYLTGVAAIYNDAKHWRERAGEARRVAAQLTDVASRNMMLKIADDYDRLAERAELRVAKRHHVLAAHRIADHGEGVLADRIVRRHVI
jgi:hypothetical protein